MNHRHKESILCDSIYRNFNNRQNDSRLSELQLPLVEIVLTGKEQEGVVLDVEMFPVLIWVVVV